MFDWWKNMFYRQRTKDRISEGIELHKLQRDAMIQSKIATEEVLSIRTNLTKAVEELTQRRYGKND